jgi:hypothetical protein
MGNPKNMVYNIRKISFYGGESMIKARKSKQLFFSVKNRTGLLSEIGNLLTNAKVNITGLCAWGMDNTAFFMLTTSSNAKAKKALSQLKVTVNEDDIITAEIPNKPGELEKVSKKIADAGIDIFYLYGTAGSGRTANCSLKTSNDKKALSAIRK